MKNVFIKFSSLIVILSLLTTCSKEIEPEIRYDLKVLVTPTEGGTVTPSGGTYPPGSDVKLTGVPSEGWLFVGWSGDYVGTENPVTITVDKSKTITSEFLKIKTTGELLSNYSELNKKTSWYITNSAFDELFNVEKSKYRGFELFNDSSLISFIPGTWSENKKNNYYWNDRGGYIYTDLTGDGNKDLWAYYLRAQWPSNKQGLHLFSEYELNPNSYDVQIGLTQVRKQVLSDLNNDDKNEIVLFSSGYDSPPFPGDSIGIFNVESRTYNYLTEDIGYFHGGSVGDVNNDGFNDIFGYSGGSEVIPVHPTLYLNKGNDSFELRNDLFKGFSSQENYYTTELFDINQDNQLDLFLASNNKLHLIEQSNGVFDFSKRIEISIPDINEPMDIDFFDFNNDGKKDILTMSNINSYNGYSVNIYIKENGNYSDRTSQYIDFPSESSSGLWIKWIYLFDYDKDGDIDIVGEGYFGDSNERVIYWRNDKGSFKRVVL
jgi:hypothetical protein